QLIISSEHQSLQKAVRLDITAMDRNAVIKMITAYYENGYSEIAIRSKKKGIYDPWQEKEKPLSEEIEFIASRLIGFEIISSQKDATVIKDVSATSPAEFNNILRRIFFLILEYQNAVLEATAARKKLATNEQLHDNITKFSSFCLRLLNLNIDKSTIEKNNLYTIITLLDKIADAIRYLARDHYSGDIELIRKMMDHFRAYYDFFYKQDIQLVNHLDKERKELKAKIASSKNREIIAFSSISEYIQALIKPTLCLMERSLAS
ncbi:hypothetical protein HYT52_00005, partial [Candidatus Woesearchaeota archaeon]|nr:hypothetical protein [Candidatus Woesearchaeota archaeon]